MSIVSEVIIDSRRFQVVDQEAVRVNLGREAVHLRPGYEIVKHVGEGWAELRKHKGSMYLDGRRIQRYLCQYQQVRHVRAEIVCEELEGQNTLNMNVRNALIMFPHLMLDEFRNSLWFWATQVKSLSTGQIFVPVVSADIHCCCAEHRKLEGTFLGHTDPAAVLE